MQYERINRSPIDVYIASNMDYAYPYKLVKPEYANPQTVKSADTVIMDSGIGDDGITNTDVLDLSERYNTDFVVAKDYLHDQNRTTESINEFINQYESHSTCAYPLIPLQPPHYEHYKSHPNHYYYLLGGLMGADSQTIIRNIEKFRQVAGMDPLVHLLGVGANQTVLRWLAHNPGMVQSIDCSTPEQCAINGKIYDVTLTQKDYALLNGDGSRDRREKLAEHLAYVLNDAIVGLQRREHSTLSDFE